MFSGLVEGCVAVLSWELRGAGAQLSIGPPALEPAAPPWGPVRGESIAVSGCCLSVTKIGPDGSLSFDLSAETLACTWFGGLEPGRLLNVERSLRLGDRLGGHLVSGHVDGMGSVTSATDSGDGGRLFRFDVDAGFERFLVEKGSVCVDGISLTVVRPEEGCFEVAVIPETLERTTLGCARVGDRIHLEADMIGKWIDRLLAER